MTEQYKRKPNTKCFVCNKPIYKRPSRIEKNGGKTFCSMSCYGISCRKEKPCIVCGKFMLSSLNKKTCSRICSNAYRSGIKYKIGRPSKDKVKSQQILKMRLLEVRSKKCEQCNYDKLEILQVHHIDRNRSNNDFQNLKLMCPNCHFEEHYL